MGEHRRTDHIGPHGAEISETAGLETHSPQAEVVKLDSRSDEQIAGGER